MQRNRGKEQNGKQTDLFKKTRDTKRTFNSNMGTIKDRNGMDLTEQKILRRGGKNTQKYKEKDFHDPDKHNGMITQPRARHLGVQSQVSLRKHQYKQS